jgi:hypothetical protein
MWMNADALRKAYVSLPEFVRKRYEQDYANNRIEGIRFAEGTKFERIYIYYTNNTKQAWQSTLQRPYWRRIL